MGLDKQIKGFGRNTTSQGDRLCFGLERLATLTSIEQEMGCRERARFILFGTPLCGLALLPER
jgi:hypothetical protein